MLRSILAFIRDLLRQAPGDTEYGVGYIDALREVEEHVLDTMWNEGEDEAD